MILCYCSSHICHIFDICGNSIQASSVWVGVSPYIHTVYKDDPQFVVLVKNFTLVFYYLLFLIHLIERPSVVCFVTRMCDFAVVRCNSTLRWIKHSIYIHKILHLYLAMVIIKLLNRKWAQTLKINYKMTLGCARCIPPGCPDGSGSPLSIR